MKKLSVSLGITAAAAAFVLSMATAPNANANRYWRFAPGQQEVQLSDYGTPTQVLCANIYNDAGTQMVGQIKAEYLGDE